MPANDCPMHRAMNSMMMLYSMLFNTTLQVKYNNFSLLIYTNLANGNIIKPFNIFRRSLRSVEGIFRHCDVHPGVELFQVTDIKIRASS